MSEEKPARIRLGMVGGGKDAFIGAVHRIAARIDDQYELVAGALSSTPEKAPRVGAGARARRGPHLRRLRDHGQARGAAEERHRGGGDRHAEPHARAGGARVPEARHPRHLRQAADRDAPEAKKLAKLAAEKRAALFILTHNYTGYPMVRQARAMVADGTLGTLRVVQVEYAQDWLATPVEETGQKQAGWRTDPARSGAGGSTGDIGTHAFNLASFVTGLRLEALAADLQAFVPGRRLDDNGHVLLRYEGGARGMLWCSQVATGNENALRLRVYGDKGGLEWAQEDPNDLWYTPLGEPKRLLTRGGAGAGRRRRGSAGRPAATPRATSRASPTSTPRRRGRSSRGAKASRCRPT